MAVRYPYNSAGNLLSASDGTTSHSYTYGNAVWRDLLTAYDGQTISYDGAGNPTSYYYITNLQGDVLSLVNTSGTAAATYTYDPYGKPLTATGTLANINPLRYRGYVYDTETGLYYLQSRYYDPELGRFINADAFTSTGQGILGNNMFAYCGNNSICYVDPSGDKHIWFQLFEDRDYGYIHRAVQEHILLVYNASSVLFGKELYIGGIGRADIYNVSTGEIWEIKHGGNTVDMQTDRTLEALEQLSKYLDSGRGLKKGNAGEFTGSFVINYDSGSYVVSYWTPVDGAILYSVGKLQNYEKSPYAVYVPKSVQLPNRNEQLSGLLGTFALIGVSGGAMGAMRKDYAY